MSVRTLLSRSDGSDVEADLTTWRPRKIRDNELLWIDVQAPTDDERTLVASALSLDAGTLEALSDGAATPDGHVLDDGMLVTVQTLREDVTQSPIVLHILIGQGWAVTWHADPIAFLDEHHERIQDQREVGRLTPVLLLVAMLDWHLDTFYAAAEELEHEVDELDEVALRGDDKNLLGRLVDDATTDRSRAAPAQLPSRHVLRGRATGFHARHRAARSRGTRRTHPPPRTRNRGRRQRPRNADRNLRRAHDTNGPTHQRHHAPADMGIGHAATGGVCSQA